MTTRYHHVILVIYLCRQRVISENTLRIAIQLKCNLCNHSIKDNELKLVCTTCLFIYHKKCTEFRSKPGHWIEPIHWSCQLCQSNNQCKDIPLNPSANIFFPAHVTTKLSGKQRKSNVNKDSPDTEFLNSTINTLTGTIARNELELKKLRESNDLKLKRIVQLETQVKEARNTFAKHKCEVSQHNSAKAGGVYS